MAESKNQGKPAAPPKSNEKLKEQVNAQAVGKVRLSERKQFTVKQDTKHLKKGQKISLNKPTEALFRAKGVID